MRDYCFLGSTDEAVAPVAAQYPEDVTKGAPYGTGTKNDGCPQFKRLASFQGDYGFHSVRRFFFENRGTNLKAPIWSYLSKRFKSVPFLGSCHGTDLPEFFNGCILQDYLIHFVHGKDPNSGSSLAVWPKYDTNMKQLLTVNEGDAGPTISIDTFRTAALNLVNETSEKYPM